MKVVVPAVFDLATATKVPGLWPARITLQHPELWKAVEKTRDHPAVVPIRKAAPYALRLPVLAQTDGLEIRRNRRKLFCDSGGKSELRRRWRRRRRPEAPQRPRPIARAYSHDDQFGETGFRNPFQSSREELSAPQYRLRGGRWQAPRRACAAVLWAYLERGSASGGRAHEYMG